MNDTKYDRDRGFMPNVFEFVWPLHFIMTNYVKCDRSLKFKLDNQFSPVDITEGDTFFI
jgi:hypothetical protein